MAEASMPRPKGVSKTDWDEFINQLGDYRGLDPATEDYGARLLELAEDIADRAEGIFLKPLVP